MDEHRKAPRINKRVKSEVRAGEHVSLSSSVDLSSGGIYISTPEPLSDGSSVKLTIIIPGNGELEIDGVVKWACSDESGKGRAGMGIEFVSVSREVSQKLETLIN